MPPSAEPWGWKQILARTWYEVGDDRALLIAAGVTYYMLLATAPSLAVIVSIYGLFTDVASVDRQVELLDGLLPSGGVQIISDQLTRLTSASQTQLSVTLIVSLLVAFWSAGAGIRALIDAMNVAYDVVGAPAVLAADADRRRADAGNADGRRRLCRRGGGDAGAARLR